jgi:hypothetical protein
MADWVGCIHQTGKPQRLCYCMVQNPIVCSLAREKANLRNMHPDVTTQTYKINEGNKCNLAELNTDLMGTLQKRQSNIGRYKAMEYFMQDNIKRLAWLEKLFNNGNVELYCEKKVGGI